MLIKHRIAGALVMMSIAGVNQRGQFGDRKDPQGRGGGVRAAMRNLQCSKTDDSGSSHQVNESTCYAHPGIALMFVLP